MLSQDMIDRINSDPTAKAAAGRFLENPVDLEQWYEGIVKRLAQKDSPYSPFHLERLLDEVGSHVDRAIRYRDIIYGYQERALTAAMELASSAKSAESLEVIQKAAWVKDQLQAAKRVEQAVAGISPEAADKDKTSTSKKPENKSKADVEELATEESISELTVTRAKAAIGVIDAMIAGETDRRTAVTNYWLSETKRRTLLAERYKVLGGPLNYDDKAEQYLALLSDDLGKIYNKCRAIQKGMKIVYGQADVVDPDEQVVEQSMEVDLLTRFALWQRAQIETITTLRLEETEFEHTIVVRNRADADGPLMRSDEYKNHVSIAGDRTLDLNLTDRFPESIGRLRVVAVGVTITTNYTGTANGEADRAAFIKVAVLPPMLGTATRRPMLFDGVGSFATGLYNRLKGAPQVENIDPRAVWTIKLGKYLYRQGLSGEMVASNILTNVQLHFRLRGVCPTTAADLTEWVDA